MKVLTSLVPAGTARSVVQLVIGAAMCGVAGGLLNACAGALIVTRSPEAARGRILAALTPASRPR